eukprot:TRINITY_DN18506_c0_g2_i1.p1 TRINITY_DN18506_c0_g2~~TRINITY_DN18506_c0_g2_i1.p1  ORF type:complete len:190 (-),score=29.48 TRINITY_DN18506_c0_g2_i1:103-672(-)
MALRGSLLLFYVVSVVAYREVTETASQLQVEARGNATQAASEIQTDNRNAAADAANRNDVASKESTGADSEQTYSYMSKLGARAATLLGVNARGEPTCVKGEGSFLADASDLLSGFCPDQGPRSGCGCAVACKCASSFQSCQKNGWISEWDAIDKTSGICRVAGWVYALAVLIPLVLVVGGILMWRSSS